MTEIADHTIYNAKLTSGFTKMEASPIEVTKVTAKRVYIRAPNRYYGHQDEPEYLNMTIDRQELEREGPQGMGVYRTGHTFRLFATRKAAERYCQQWTVKASGEAATDAATVKQLRREMLDAHPDRGGTTEMFMEATDRYGHALALLDPDDGQKEPAAANGELTAIEGGTMKKNTAGIDLFEQGGKFGLDDAALDAELRESMRTVGWLRGSQVVTDENGMIITGHRRNRVARELAAEGFTDPGTGELIEPETVVFEFGAGGGADIRRVQTAVWSNTGGRRFPREVRQQVAVHMVVELAWPQQAAAAALGVSQQTISNDVSSLITSLGNKRESGAQPAAASPQAQETAKATGNRKRAAGAGRPRKAPVVPFRSAGGAQDGPEDAGAETDAPELAEPQGSSPDQQAVPETTRRFIPRKAPKEVPPGLARHQAEMEANREQVRENLAPGQGVREKTPPRRPADPVTELEVQLVKLSGAMLHVTPDDTREAAADIRARLADVITDVSQQALALQQELQPTEHPVSSAETVAPNQPAVPELADIADELRRLTKLKRTSKNFKTVQVQLDKLQVAVGVMELLMELSSYGCVVEDGDERLMLTSSLLQWPEDHLAAEGLFRSPTWPASALAEFVQFLHDLDDGHGYGEGIRDLIKEAGSASDEYEAAVDDTSLSADDREGVWEVLVDALEVLANKLGGQDAEQTPEPEPEKPGKRKLVRKSS